MNKEKECSIVEEKGIYTVGDFDVTNSINLILKEAKQEIERLKLNIKIMQERIDKLNEEKEK